MTLQRELEARRAEADPAYLARIADAADHLVRSGLPLRVKRTGDAAPDFALAAAGGRPVVLSDLLRRGPVVMSVFRGEWCAFCRAEIDALLAAQPAFARRGASLVLLSPDVPSASLVAAVARLGERAAVLQDPRLGVALLYGLVYRVPEVLRTFYLAGDAALARRLDAAGWMLPLPADVVVGTDGRIVVSFADPDVTRRLDPALILETLATIDLKPGIVPRRPN